MTFKPTILAAGLAAVALTTAEARDTVVVLSPNQDPAALKIQTEMVVRHLAATLDRGEEALFFDGAAADLIATFAVPDKAAYANPRAKLQANKPALAALKTLIDRAASTPGGVAGIDIPGVLRTVREHYRTEAGADIIVLGAPIYDGAPAFSMAGGRVPNDDHIAASSGDSPFGTADLSGAMAGYDVYFGLIGPGRTVSTSHAWRLERFWTLLAEAHGASSMAYYGGDLATLFRLAGRDAPDRHHAAPLAPTGKLEMLHFAPEGTVEALYAAEPQIAPAASWRAATDLRIGISWDNCPTCDLDLYVGPAPGAPVIFYGQPSSSTGGLTGRLYKDFTDAPRGGFETVALSGAPVDLSQVLLAVNFYAGRSVGGVTGEIRIAIGGEVWAQAFTIEATSGNRGTGASEMVETGAAPNAAWIVIDPVPVVAPEDG